MRRCLRGRRRAGSRLFRLRGCGRAIGLCGGLEIRRLLCFFVSVCLLDEGVEEREIPGEDIICNGSNVILVTQGTAECQHQGCLARPDGSVSLALLLRLHT